MRDQALADIVDWASAELGLGPLRFVRSLRKGGSSDIVELHVRGTGTAQDTVIVRRYCDAAWLEREPHLPANEVRMTQFAHEAGLPAPRILGRRLENIPLVAMSALPGAPVEAKDVDRKRIERAARAAQAIHKIPTPEPLGRHQVYSPHYFHTLLRPQCPNWTRVPRVWNSAIQLYEAFKPASPKALLHRDFHFGNLLFSDCRLTGMIDWVTACFGDPQADISHMRWNLLVSHGEDAMIAFTEAYYVDGSECHDPIWDIYALTGALPDITDMASREADRLDAFMERALATLGVA